MIVNRFTVILDTNVLFGALHRNVALSLAEAGLFRPRWTIEILDELERSLSQNVVEASIARQQRERIEQAFEESVVDVDPTIVDSLNLPDRNDNHVLAASIKARAALIVTDNLKHFPKELLSQHEVEAISPDHFFADTFELDEHTAVFAIRKMRQRLNNPKYDAESLILRFEQVGLTETARLLNEYVELL